MRRPCVAALLSAFAACGASPWRDAGQDPPADEAAAAAPAELDAPSSGWELEASGAYYALPDEPDYAYVTATADREALHLEARYQYEDRDTGSAWVGWNVGAGDELRLDLTLMGGAVFGNTTGFAPGYHFALSYGVLDLLVEGEYLVSTEDHAENFFYSWSELGITPVDWLRFGAAGQRTKVFEEESVLDPGLFVGIALHGVSVTAYAFALDEDAFYVFSLGAGF